MDAFKFAFETTIVGVLAFPWVALVASIFLPKLPLNKGESDGTPVSLVSKILEPAALSVLVLAAAYFLGSAISPVATQLLDDPDMPTLKIREIRAEVYKIYSAWLEPGPASDPHRAPLYSHEAGRLLSNCHATTDEQKCWMSADSLFLLQEYAVLKEGSDKTERVSRLFERVIVLRGAVFNAFAFVVLCSFAYFSRQSDQPIHLMWSNSKMIFRSLMLIAISGALIFFACKYGKPDVFHHDISDPPIMESGLFVFGVIGLFTLFQGVTKRVYFQALIAGLLLTGLAYGGWVWTEFLYTKNVIGAFFATRVVFCLPSAHDF